MMGIKHKRHFLIGILLFSVVCLHAQYEYQPFVKEGKMWNMDKNSGNSVFSYRMQGDTVISGDIMKKVYLVEGSGSQYIGAVKELRHQVYIVYAGQKSAMLLYDFDAPVNTIIMYGEEYGAEIDYRGLSLLNSTLRHIQHGAKWSASDGEYIPSVVFHVEGIGSVEGMDPFQHQRWNKCWVTSCYDNGECLYYYGDFGGFYDIEPTYAPLLKHRRSWKSRNTTSGNEVLLTVQYDTIFYNNEERFTGQLYRKVYCVDNQKYGDAELHYYGAMREEGTKVYLVLDGKGVSERQLLFDFGLMVGEEAVVEGCTVKVTESDSIVSEGRKYRRLTLHLVENNKDTGRTCHWTEGIGSYCGLLHPLPWDATDGLLLTVCDDSTCIYDNNGIVNRIGNQTSQRFFPNGCYDLQGRRIGASLNDKGQMINERMKKGIYIRDGRKVVNP